MRQMESGVPKRAIPEDSPSLSRVAYTRLREDILSNALEPDQPLRLEFLRERYGLSFSPLREALNQLQVERLVSSTSNRGFRVATVSLKEMWDAIDTRILIETEALRQSLAHGDDDWEGDLVSSLHALDKCRRRLADQNEPPTPKDLETLEARHQQFHGGLLGACPSVLLIQLSATLYAQTERYRRPLLSTSAPETVGAMGPDDEHRAMTAAALDRDAETAVALLRRHLTSTGQFIEAAHRRKAASLPPIDLKAKRAA
ncbi:GntR family transcriptional regulator [uncultured Sphingomonas sp.]|uniref:GntR family transcriptional regulator n=1 Tax=uncultured Sphingomonas sp. TaxID=158754 RepID=UPI0035CBFE82